MGAQLLLESLRAPMMQRDFACLPPAGVLLRQSVGVDVY